MRVLSRLPERSMLGFSKLVASEVTQPLWPSSWPRITNCSAMLGGYGLGAIWQGEVLCVGPC